MRTVFLSFFFLLSILFAAYSVAQYSKLPIVVKSVATGKYYNESGQVINELPEKYVNGGYCE